jgi:uncharacterized protein YndB with AHSA1/START domain
MLYTPPRQTDLLVTRRILASPEALFAAWLDPAQPGSPWHGAQAAVVEARVGGLFYHCVVHEGREWAHYGRFLVLEHPRHIVHTWVSEATRGLETRVSLLFTAEGAQTLVTLQHAGVPDDAFGRQHVQGWEYVLGALTQGRAAAPR